MSLSIDYTVPNKSHPSKNEKLAIAGSWQEDWNSQNIPQQKAVITFFEMALGNAKKKQRRVRVHDGVNGTEWQRSIILHIFLFSMK